MVKVINIPPSVIWNMTEDIDEHIKKAIEHSNGEFDAISIYEQVSQGLMSAWIVSDEEYNIMAVLITELVTYPLRSMVRIVLCGGEKLDKWLDTFLNKMDEYARNLGASGIEVVGRKGWERMLKNYGYEYTYTALFKEVA
jgi:hypothetical protein